MKSFTQNRPMIENEYELANFDPATGLDVEILRQKLQEIQDTPTDEPRALVFAKAYAYLLDNLQLEINEHTPFSVKFNVGIDYSYFATNSILETVMSRPQRTKVLREKMPEDLKKAELFRKVGVGYFFTDFWHTVPNWTNVIKYGFAGILENTKTSKQKWLDSGKIDQDQINFFDSVIICYEAILRLLNRVYEYSLKFDVPAFSAAIKNLTTKAPETLYEVMLISALYLNFEEFGRERGRTLGPIDRMYLPYYKNDLANGVPMEEIDDLFRYYFIHFTAAKRYAEQPFTICGCDKDGNDLSNELSLKLLEIYDELNIYDPKIQVRYHKNLDNKIFRQALKMIRGGHSSICIINDAAVFSGYERIGIPVEDAQNYVVLGCYEPIIMGEEEGEIAPVRLNTVKCIEFALNGGKDLITGDQVGFESTTDITSFEQFFQLFLDQVDYCTEWSLDFLRDQSVYNTMINPAPIYSSTFDACIEKGRDVHEYPLKYNNLSIKHLGLATVVDSLMAIKKYVFEKKEITLAELTEALKNDWRGYEDLQTRIIKDTEKYGNNLPLPDALMVKITKHWADRYCARKLKRGGVLRLGLDSVYHCVAFGEMTAASPNGRNCGTPFSKNMCATEGQDRGGITALMQSLLKVDAADFVDATIFDFIMHPSAVEGDKGLNDFESLMKIFFAGGGFAAQGNIVSGEMLKDAQANPEKYSTLQVRVCGWNEYFVKLSKVKQDLFIKQCEVSG
ncbi:MAG: hypothetical protein E7636_06365 [Ruminococcaceae bacterium]|nr:hypothetical protein [Oscillospiraceae bacterium]